MKIFRVLFCIFILKILLITGNQLRYNKADIVTRSRENHNLVVQPHNIASKIKLVDNMDEQSTSVFPKNKFLQHSHHHHQNKIIPHKKSGPISTSLFEHLKSFSFQNQKHEEEDHEIEHDEPEALEGRQPKKEIKGHGWGWEKPKKREYHKHEYNVKGGGVLGSLTLLDLLLGSLSLISFGAFLMNILGALVSIFGGGNFITYPTVTYPTTNTATSTSTSTTGAGVINSLTSYFRKGGISKGLRKKKKKKYKSAGTIQADLGIGNIKGGWTKRVASGSSIADDEQEDFVDENDDEMSARNRIPVFKKRVKRSLLWEPSVHPYTSLDVATRNILNSIESIHSKYECMEMIICESNKHAKIIGRGLEYFMPIYTFSTSYFGQKFGLHKNLKSHLRAILGGFEQANCNTNFPQCSHPSSLT